MTLQNPGFEQGYTGSTTKCYVFTPNGTYETNRGEVQAPAAWQVCYVHDPDFRPLWDPQNTDGWCEPEVKIIPKEVTFLDPPRISEGVFGMKFFTMWRIHQAGLRQPVPAVVGKRYRFTMDAHAWSSNDDNPYTSDGVGAGAFFALAGTVTDDARRNFTLKVGIDPTGGLDPFAPSVVWGVGAHVYNVHHALPPVEVVAEAAQVTVFVLSTCMWRLKHNDVYFDNAVLEVLDPEPPECYGLPREDYARRYNVYPTNATIDRRREIAAYCADVQQTCGPSYDDAGIGDLTDKTAVLWDIPADKREDFLDFYLQYYPGVIVEFAGNSPEPLRLTYPTTHMPPEITQPFIPNQHGGIDLRASWDVWGDEVLCAYPGTVVNDTADFDATFGYFVLTRATTADSKPIELRYAHLKPDVYVKQGATVQRGQKLGKADNTGTSTGDHLHFSVKLDGMYVDPDPLIDWPTTPQPPIVASIRPEGTRGNFGLHWMPNGQDGVQEWHQTIIPPACKLATPGGGGPQLVQIRQWSPKTLLVYRRVEDALNRFDPVQAYGLVQRYIADLSPHFNLTDFSKAPIYCESGNEWYEGRRPDLNAAARDWDIAFMNAIEASGLNLKAVVYTAAVGNPEPDAQDLDVILPMVEKACTGNHLLGKHCYWASLPGQPAYYQTSWQWYGGRFSLDDAYFVSKGLSPYWMLGESGACEATIKPDGTVTLNSGAGWRTHLNIEQYAAQIIWANAWYENWNQAHGGRLLIAAPFTSYAWGWDNFLLNGGDLRYVTTALAGVL